MSDPTHRYSLAPYRPVALDDLVRVGRDYDGGYVVPQRVIAATRVVLGLGINADWSFEDGFVRANPSVRVIGVDGSVSAGVYIRWAVGGAARGILSTARGRFRDAVEEVRSVRGHVRVSREFSRFFDGSRHVFVRKFLADSDSATTVTWESLAREHGLRSGDGARPDVFVKMDIEGSEYRTLPALLADAARISGLVVEFHDCDLLWERFVELMAGLARDFAVAHEHGNNCVSLIAGTTTPRVLEFTFVNRRLLARDAAPSAQRYPLIDLDMPNDPARPDYALQF